MTPNRPLRHKLATLTAAFALVGTMAVGANSPAQADPTASSPQGHSIYTTMPSDPTAVVLGSEEFPAHADGVGDDTAVIQAAVNEASRRGGENWLGNIVGGDNDRGVKTGDGGGVVFVPEGRYRITGRINLFDSVRLIGFGDKRPEFYIAPSTPAFGGSEPEFMFAAVRRPVSFTPVTFGNNDTFGTGLVNLNIKVDEGNPQAVGARWNGAQLFVLQDVDMDMGDGYAGIDHNANLIQRVNVRGGQYGMLAFAASPGWQTTVLDSTFTNHSKAGFVLHTDAKLSIIRTQFEDMPLGIDTQPGLAQRLYVQHSIFKDIDGPAITLNDSESIGAPVDREMMQAENQLNIVDSGVVNAGALLRTQPSGRTWTVPADSYHVNDATLGLRIHDAFTPQERRITDVVVDAQPKGESSFKRLLKTDIPLPPDSSEWINIAGYAAERGVQIGQGEDDHAIFQQALNEHETVYVPIGEYIVTESLELRPENNLIGLHPRQTWLKIPNETPFFSDADNPRGIVHTPIDGTNIVMGLGFDSEQNNAGSAHVHWQSGPASSLSDVATQFVKYAPETTEPGNPSAGNLGYQYRGVGKYNFWVDGGGGAIYNLWAMAGYAENGLMIENTEVRGRVYEVSIEHHQHREVVLHNVRNWEIHALETEDHIYGWESQAVEMDNVHDVLFGNTVFFRVATVLGPYPYAMGIKDSTNVVVRGTRGFRNVNTENTRWGATMKDVETGHIIPELDIAYLGVKTSGREARQTGVSLIGPPKIAVLPGHNASAQIELRNNGSGPLTGISVSAAGEGFTAEVTAPSRVAGGAVGLLDMVLTADESLPPGEHDVTFTVAYTTQGKTRTLDYVVPVMVGGENVALTSSVTGSSTLLANVPTNVIDASTTGNRWVSAAGDPLPTLTFDLGKPADLNRVVLYSGVTGSTALRVDSFEVHGLVAGEWQLLGSITGNSSNPVEVKLTDADAVEQVRIQFAKPSARDGQARVFEVEIYGLR